jgi:3-(3-hydroxy-phenyl)propionate hydroxylase
LVARYFNLGQTGAPQDRQIRYEVLRNETAYPFVVQTEQHKLARMGIERLKTFVDADVRFDTRVTNASQDAGGATVTGGKAKRQECFAPIM